MYVAAFGFVGKLDMKSGNYIWEHNNLYQDSKYQAFASCRLLENNQVLFESKNTRDTLIIDDLNGKIIRQDRTSLPSNSLALF